MHNNEGSEGDMKFLVLFFIAFSLTLAWQTHARADSQQGPADADSQAVMEENRQAGRVELSEGDCD